MNATMAKARTRRQPPGVAEAHRHRGRAPADRQQPTPDRAGRGDGHRPAEPPMRLRAAHDRAGRVRAQPWRPSAGPARAVHALDHVARKVVGVGSVGTRAWIAAHGRGGRRRNRCSCRPRRPSLRAGRLLRPGRVRQPGRTRRRGATPHAGRPATSSSGGQRTSGVGRGRTATSTSASCGTGRSRRAIEEMGPPDAALCPACAAGRWPARTPGPVTASRSPPTWAGRDTFDDAIAEFAEAYAAQNERDHAAFQDAVKQGRAEAVRGV